MAKANPAECSFPDGGGQAADSEATERKRQIYEVLAAFECDRYDSLVARYLRRGEPDAAAPSLRLPRGSRSGEPIRAAKVAAEAERRTWKAMLDRTPRHDPQHTLVRELFEDARRVRDQLLPAPQVR